MLSSIALKNVVSMYFYNYINKINPKERYIICALLILIFLLCSLLLIEKFKLIPESVKINFSESSLTQKEKDNINKAIKSMGNAANFKI